MVELRNLMFPRGATRALVMHNGSFEFRDLEAGNYEATITNERGEIIQQDLVSVRPMGEPLVLRLHQQQTGRLPSGTIALGKLLHPVPPKAEREFRRSREASQAGHPEKEIEHLEKAIEIYPAYVEAHNNLGACYMALKQYDNAAAEFQKTIALDERSVNGHLNLSLALGSLRRYPEGEASARRALELAPDSVPARYTLGQILVAQGKNTPEALENLRKAAGQFPKTRLLIARVQVLRDAIPEAAGELREYLNSGNSWNRQEVENWLERLTRNPAR